MKLHRVTLTLHNISHENVVLNYIELHEIEIENIVCIQEFNSCEHAYIVLWYKQ